MTSGDVVSLLYANCGTTSSLDTNRAVTYRGPGAPIGLEDFDVNNPRQKWKIEAEPVAAILSSALFYGQPFTLSSSTDPGVFLVVNPSSNVVIASSNQSLWPKFSMRGRSFGIPETPQPIDRGCANNSLLAGKKLFLYVGVAVLAIILFVMS